jgi:hypothetical protein
MSRSSRRPTARQFCCEAAAGRPSSCVAGPRGKLLDCHGPDERILNSEHETLCSPLGAHFDGLASATPSLRAIQEATNTIPVVAVDPVNAGFVRRHACPGGNITGVASQYEEIVIKQVQLLAEEVPGLSRVVLLRHTSVGPATVTAAAAAAGQAGPHGSGARGQRGRRVRDRLQDSPGQPREGNARAAQPRPRRTPT